MVPVDTFPNMDWVLNSLWKQMRGVSVALLRLRLGDVCAAVRRSLRFLPQISAALMGVCGFLCLSGMPVRSKHDPYRRGDTSSCCGAGYSFAAAMETAGRPRVCRFLFFFLLSKGVRDVRREQVNPTEQSVLVSQRLQESVRVTLLQGSSDANAGEQAFW